MADKLFYSYNATWINNNSIKYTEKYSYAFIVNPKNHILAYNGKDYGVFHNENYISCIPQSNFVNVSNVVSNPAVTKIYIKIPSNPHTIWTANTGAGSPANTSSLVPSDGQHNKLNFDLCINASIYHISANINSSTKSKKFWSNCNVLKLSNSNVSNDSVSFGYYRTAGSGNLSEHSYLPFISINGLNPGLGTPVSIYNISFSTQTNSGFNTTDYPNLNYVDNDKTTTYMWEIKINPSGAYFVDTTVTNSQMITNSKLPIRTIWGQAFDGTGNVQGNLIINSYTHGNTTEQGVLKTNYVNINCEDTSNQLAVAGTGVISNTTYLCSGGGNAYIGISNITTDAIVNNGALQAKLFVNGISYASKLNINSKDTSLNYACRIAGKNSSSTGGSSSQYSIYATNGWNYLASNTGIGIVPNTNYKLHIKGTSTSATGGDSSHYALYTDYGWNYLASNTGIGITPNINYKLYVSGRTYLNENVGIGVAPDTGSTYRLKVDGSSSHLSTLFSNGKIILNDEYTFIQKFHQSGLKPHYDANAGGSHGVIDLYITSNYGWPSSISDSQYNGTHKILNVQANPLSEVCGIWSMAMFKYIGNNYYQRTKYGYISNSILNYNSENRCNGQLGGLNMILYYHNAQANNGDELLNNVNYVFRSAYKNKILLYGGYTANGTTSGGGAPGSLGAWYYTTPNNEVYGSWGNAYANTDLNKALLKEDTSQASSILIQRTKYLGDFGGNVSCIEGNVYNIVCLGVIQLYKSFNGHYWHFNNNSYSTNYNYVPAGQTGQYGIELIINSGLLIFGRYFPHTDNKNLIGGTQTDLKYHDGLDPAVINVNHGLAIRARVNPNITWKRGIHVAHLTWTTHTTWGANDSSICGQTSPDGQTKYTPFVNVSQNDITDIRINATGATLNDDGRETIRTASIAIFGWLFDYDY